MDSSIDLNSHGFDSIDTVNKESTGSGVIDATVSSEEAAPLVVPTDGENTFEQTGPHGYDNTVYGGDPYGSSTPTEPAFNGGGPAK